MDREFTRIEFEDGSVVVIKPAVTPGRRGEFTVQGNRISNWGYQTGFDNLSHDHLVDRVIDNTGKKVVRAISHSLK